MPAAKVGGTAGGGRDLFDGLEIGGYIELEEFQCLNIRYREEEEEEEEWRGKSTTYFKSNAE